MNDIGGTAPRPHEPTSFRLQPPQPAQAPLTEHAPAPAAQVAPQSDPGAGRLVAGRYRLLSRLGHGGMGTVWRARDEVMDREVAVKESRIPDHLPERERAGLFERMRREARAAARLDHPAVVNVHDVAVEEGQPWIVMEFVQGRSLGDALQEGTLGARDAARIGLEVLGALEAAHAAGILHRDVKPDNVMLGRHDRVILTDFGIAQIEGETKLTETGGFVGSPEFIAPERVLGQQPGSASDLWSLGVVLYAATEGVSPFRRTNTPATLQAVLNATPAAPSAAGGGPLAEAVQGLLQKDPARRPNATRVRELLERAVQPPPPVVRTGGPEAGKGVRLGRKALAGGAAAVVALAAGAYLVLADPFAGPLPEGWKKHQEAAPLNADIAVPAGYLRIPDDADPSVITYKDPSGAVTVELARWDHVRQKSDISGTADAQAFKDSDAIKGGSFSGAGLSMSSDTKTGSSTDANVTYQERDAALNTVTYGTSGSGVDIDGDVPREAKAFYYRTHAGDMYRLWVDYPGKGDFTARGREIARIAIANLDVRKP
ncbi:serine/threonine-protein kinase [Streptomyces angustmyceticus]|uniref:non-specific serine/threonine protein kinase n=1 Tax=Streptomyces angustmyceticus TaxID=285578 RepID=A0A5J4LRG4_9ACTN|nr:serine/threonine-protein kinase [Streptomyces angustmyceticus]UAL69531.1 serine/threonine protein kinase [Streptomyces angustmyceticus]GES34170.1 protein kinase [Streptomyces angustmyceticus]